MEPEGRVGRENRGAARGGCFTQEPLQVVVTSVITKPWGTVLLVGVIIWSLWVGQRMEQYRRAIDGEVSSRVLFTVYQVNRLVDIIQDPTTDWDSLGFRAELWQRLGIAVQLSDFRPLTHQKLFPELKHSTLSYLTDVKDWFETYPTTIAFQLVDTPGPVAEADKAKLKQMAAHLQQANFPNVIQPDVFDFGRKEFWVRLRNALEQFLKAEGACGRPPVQCATP